MQENFELGERLKQARQRKGLNKSKLADLVGTSGTSINNIEKGETKHPSAELLAKIASALDVSFDWLLKGEGKEPGLSYKKGNTNTNTNTLSVGNVGSAGSAEGDCRQQLAVAVVKIESLESLLKEKEATIKDRDSQIAFLKSLLQK